VPSEVIRKRHLTNLYTDANGDIKEFGAAAFKTSKTKLKAQKSNEI
jgi:hypothetical protein